MKDCIKYSKDLPKSVHIMNKDERKMLRKLKIKYGMTESELREHKKFRIILSEAQKEGQKPKRNILEKKLHLMTKMVCKELKLPKEHPLVVEKIKKLNNSYGYYGY